ncbi:MAG TPA: autotransporter-associated beta strand repeat-containing protein [Verrucomicrobiales bacterium]|nr:autotransporter-associated beta strand repeat-containing protein [Verrucomicrobiales bacterium]
MNRTPSAFIFVSLLSGPASVYANFNWNVAGPADWNTASNWVDTGLPADNDRFVNNGGTATITGNDTLTPQRDTKVGFGAGTSGTINHSAGNHTTPGWLFIGIDGGTGTYNLANTAATGGLYTGMGQGSGSINTGDLRIGEGTGGSNGTLNVNTSSTITTTGWLYVGVGGGGTARMNMDNGTANVAGQFLVGQGTTGIFRISGGSVISGADTWVGNAAGGNGTVLQTGGVVKANNWLAIGRDTAVGNYTLSGGTLEKAGDNHVIIGSLSGQGTLTQNGATSNFIVNNDLRLGENGGGSGTYNISAGTGTVGGNTIVGWVGTGSGFLTVSGTGNFSTLNVIVGDGGPGTVSLNGGTTTTNQFIRGAGGGAVTVNFNGGVLKAASNQTEFFTGGFSAANTEIQVGGLILNSNGFNVATAVGLDGVGGVTKQGAGTLTLTGASTYTGATTVSQGTLLANNATGSATGTGNVTVASGATFGGTGAISGAVITTSGSFLSPGASIESLNVGAASGAGTLKIEFDGAAGTPIDTLAVLANLDITTMKVDFDQIGGSLNGTSSYPFASYGTLTGTAFSTVTDLPAGYAINYHVGGGNVIGLVPVPEPALTGMIAGAGLLFLRRRRR